MMSMNFKAGNGQSSFDDFLVARETGAREAFMEKYGLTITDMAVLEARFREILESVRGGKKDGRRRRDTDRQGA